MAKKVTKKAAQKSDTPRVKLSDISQTERDSRSKALIDELYGSNLEADEKSKRRQRLRALDPEWGTTYASYIEKNGYGRKAAEVKEKPKVTKKVSKKAAVPASA